VCRIIEYIQQEIEHILKHRKHKRSLKDLDRQYLLKDQETLPRGLKGPPGGLSALLKGSKTQGAPSPRRRLNQLLEASRAQQKDLSTLIT